MMFCSRVYTHDFPLRRVRNLRTFWINRSPSRSQWSVSIPLPWSLTYPFPKPPFLQKNKTYIFTREEKTNPEKSGRPNEAFRSSSFVLGGSVGCWCGRRGAHGRRKSPQNAENRDDSLRRRASLSSLDSGENEENDSRSFVFFLPFYSA